MTEPRKPSSPPTGTPGPRVSYSGARGPGGGAAPHTEPFNSAPGDCSDDRDDDTPDEPDEPEEPEEPELPAVPVELVRRALSRPPGAHLTGEWDRVLIVTFPGGRETLTITVKPRGLRVTHTGRKLRTVGRRVVPEPVVLAESYLVPGTPEWRRAVDMLELAAELAPAIDTRGT